MSTANAMSQKLSPLGATRFSGRADPAGAPGHFPPSSRPADRRIDFLDTHMSEHIEDLLREALGPRIMLDLSIDPDAWPISGDRDGFEAMLEQFALDAHTAMGGDGVLHMCVLNVHDRCGGRHDEVLVALSDTGRATTEREGAGISDIRGWPRGRAGAGYRPGILLAERFAVENGAVFDMAGGPAAGTTMSLTFPRALTGDALQRRPAC